MRSFFKQRSIIGNLIKIAGIVVMGWGLIQAMIFLATTSGMGGQIFNEFGEAVYVNSSISDLSLYGFIHIIGKHVLYGILIIGFGEVIDLLQDIYFRLDPKAKEAWEQKQEERQKFFNEIPLWVEQDITAFYKDEGETVESVQVTTDRNVYEVKVNGRVEFVEVSGFKPRVLLEEEARKYEG
ncbi:hypothetical protein [Sporosarcina sp. Te-1]|uniref:hypothetical protein n=1 Tax=Sporosarcina sp. Te-1 TaxID=2818390 RepID=UPI001A9F22A2|nr:hypothetical protein [Sporosarcina sp. Te-1]QTD39967.1 hypothetical protein J3U78_14155 [Sporosarcina sp. Te-1]